MLKAKSSEKFLSSTIFQERCSESLGQNISETDSDDGSVIKDNQ